MKRTSSISKSVRFPEHLVAFIDRQPPKDGDFTSKLIGLLEECSQGEEKRKQNIAYYDALIKRRQTEVTAYNDLLSNIRRFRQVSTSTEHLLSDLLEALKKLESARQKNDK